MGRRGIPLTPPVISVKPYFSRTRTRIPNANPAASQLSPTTGRDSGRDDGLTRRSPSRVINLKAKSNEMPLPETFAIIDSARRAPRAPPHPPCFCALPQPPATASRHTPTGTARLCRLNRTITRRARHGLGWHARGTMDATRAYAPLTPPRAARKAAGSGLRSAKLWRARARGVRCGASGRASQAGRDGSGRAGRCSRTDAQPSGNASTAASSSV